MGNHSHQFIFALKPVILHLPVLSAQGFGLATGAGVTDTGAGAGVVEGHLSHVLGQSLLRFLLLHLLVVFTGFPSTFAHTHQFFFLRFHYPFLNARSARKNFGLIDIRV